MDLCSCKFDISSQIADAFICKVESGMLPLENASRLLLTTTIRSGLSSTSSCIPNADLRMDSGFVTFTPNSKFLLASTQDSTVRLWNYHTSRCVKTYTGHTNRTYCIPSSIINGKYVVSGSEDGKIYVWNLQSRTIAQVLEGHKGTSSSF